MLEFETLHVFGGHEWSAGQKAAQCASDLAEFLVFGLAKLTKRYEQLYLLAR